MWFWYAFASAITSAISITFNKYALSKIHAPLLSWALFAFSLPILVVLSIKGGVPDINSTFVFAILSAALVLSIAKTVTLEVMKNNKLSEFYPLAAVTPLTLYLLSLVFLSETIKPLAFWGMMTTVVGVYLFNFKKGDTNILQPFKLLFSNRASNLFLATIILFNFTAIFEKTSLNSSVPKNPAFVILLEYSLITLILSGYMTHKDRYWLREIKSNFKNLFLAGIIYSIHATLVITAFAGGSIALVSAIKKLEVVFVLILSAIFFADKPRKLTYIATLIMLIGVFLIKL